MKKLLMSLLAIGFVFQSFAQVTKDTNLPEVVIRATNYKYLNSIDLKDVADVSVKTIQQKVADFDLKNAEFYQDEYDLYRVSFFIPDGKILAAYDKEGNVLRTVERFKNVKLPLKVTKAVGKRFPAWALKEDVYFVRYHEAQGVTKKWYKIKLENGDKKLKVKVDEDGNFL